MKSGGTGGGHTTRLDQPETTEAKFYLHENKEKILEIKRYNIKTQLQLAILLQWLKEKVFREYMVSITNKMFDLRIYWMDDEGEQIRLDDDNDLRYAFNYCSGKKKLNPMKFHIYKVWLCSLYFISESFFFSYFMFNKNWSIWFIEIIKKQSKRIF